jgi:hypothetical protein
VSRAHARGPKGPAARSDYPGHMYEEDRELRDVMLERRALEFLLAHACETLLFYADRGNYNAADDGLEDAAIDALTFIAGADASSVRG